MAIRTNLKHIMQHKPNLEVADFESMTYGVAPIRTQGFGGYALLSLPKDFMALHIIGEDGRQSHQTSDLLVRIINANGCLRSIVHIREVEFRYNEVDYGQSYGPSDDAESIIDHLETTVDPDEIASISLLRKLSLDRIPGAVEPYFLPTTPLPILSKAPKGSASPDALGRSTLIAQIESLALAGR